MKQNINSKAKINNNSKHQSVSLLLSELEEGEKSVTDESQWVSEDKMVAEFGKF